MTPRCSLFSRLLTQYDQCVYYTCECHVLPTFSYILHSTGTTLVPMALPPNANAPLSRLSQVSFTCLGDVPRLFLNENPHHLALIS